MADYWRDRHQTRTEGTYLAWDTDRCDWSVVEKGRVITDKQRSGRSQILHSFVRHPQLSGRLFYVLKCSL